MSIKAYAIQAYYSSILSPVEPRGPFHSDQELWDALALNLRHLPQQVLEILNKRLPKYELYVLTAVDASYANSLL